MDIYVGNLPFKTNEDGLRELFAQHGSVSSAKVVSDFETGRSKGFGFVTMDNDDEGNNAIAALDGSSIEGRPLKVNQARPRTERRPFEGGGGGQGGGGGFRPQRRPGGGGGDRGFRSGPREGGGGGGGYGRRGGYEG